MVADPVKDGSREAIAALAEMSIASAMVTGDNRRTAQAVAGATWVSYLRQPP